MNHRAQQWPRIAQPAARKKTMSEKKTARIERQASPSSVAANASQEPASPRPVGGAPIALKSGPRVFETLLGSWSQGMAQAGSDSDWRGVFLSGPSQWAEPLNAAQEERADPLADGLDCVFWSQWRFAQFLGQANFMALKLLYCAPEFIERDDGQLAVLRAQRERFLTRQTIDGLLGVAQSQLKIYQRITERPAADGKAEKPSKIAAHALRLSRMGVEIAERGEFLVHRADAQEILAVKSGERRHEDAVKEALSTIQKARSMRNAAPVPAEADEEWAREWARAYFYEELARRGADPKNWADGPAAGIVIQPHNVTPPPTEPGRPKMGRGRQR